MKKYIESFCRGWVVLLLSLSIHLSPWYQNLEGMAKLNDFYAWVVSISIIFCIVWIILPIVSIFKFKNKTQINIEEKEINK